MINLIKIVETLVLAWMSVNILQTFRPKDWDKQKTFSTNEESRVKVNERQ